MSKGDLGPKGWEVPTRTKETRGPVENVNAANNKLVKENNILRKNLEDSRAEVAALTTENNLLKGTDMATKIRAALEQLNPKDNSAWTEVGLPKVEAVCVLVENNEVTRADIEAALPGFERPKPDPAG
jgi:predicted nuclease with TOPRIM domain